MELEVMNKAFRIHKKVQSLFTLLDLSDDDLLRSVCFMVTKEEQDEFDKMFPELKQSLKNIVSNSVKQIREKIREHKLKAEQELKDL